MTQPLPSFKCFLQYKPQHLGFTENTFLQWYVLHKNTQTATADKILTDTGPAFRNARFVHNLESYKSTMELDTVFAFHYKCRAKLQWMSVIQLKACHLPFHLLVSHFYDHIASFSLVCLILVPQRDPSVPPAVLECKHIFQLSRLTNLKKNPKKKHLSNKQWALVLTQGKDVVGHERRAHLPSPASKKHVPSLPKHIGVIANSLLTGRCQVEAKPKNARSLVEMRMLSGGHMLGSCGEKPKNVSNSAQKFFQWCEFVAW